MLGELLDAICTTKRKVELFQPKLPEELRAKYGTPGRLRDNMDRGGTSADMIYHCCDKLLHISRPSVGIARNP